MGTLEGVHVEKGEGPPFRNSNLEDVAETYLRSVRTAFGEDSSTPPLGKRRQPLMRMGAYTRVTS